MACTSLMAYNAGSNQNWALNTDRVSVAVNNSVDLTNLDWCPTCGVCNNYNLLIDSYFMNKTDEASAFMLCYCTNDLSDESLINLINRVARAKSEGPFLTLSTAMNWAITNGVFVTNQNYPQIVTSGNTLNLDAGLPSSYPKTGTVWYDLTNNPNNNGTLVNGVTYNSGSKGYLSFNGTNRYISFTTPTNIPIGNSNYTISVWFMPGSISIGNEGLVGWGNYGTTNQVNAFKLTPTGLSNYWGANDLSVTTTLSNGNWYNAVATFDGTTRGIWVNGTLIGSDTPTGHNVSNANNLTIGLTNTNEYYTGIISEVQIFNRGLTNNEIISNYNALLTRYNGSDTNICVTPTYCPQLTSTPTPTQTPTQTQTGTAAVTPTNTQTPTNTATNTTTPTVTPTVTPTATPYEVITGTGVCNVAVNGGSGGRGYFEYTIQLGSDTGTIPFTFDAYTVTDQFQVYWNGTMVIDTGFRGSSSYNAQLNALGYPNVSGPGAGSSSFNKTSASPTTALVVITAPIAGTAWEFLVGCPPIPPTTTPTNTQTPTQTYTPTQTPTVTQTPTNTPIPSVEFSNNDCIILYGPGVGGSYTDNCSGTVTVNGTSAMFRAYAYLNQNGGNVNTSFDVIGISPGSYAEQNTNSGTDYGDYITLTPGTYSYTLSISMFNGVNSEGGIDWVQ